MIVRTATTFVRLLQIAEHLLSDTRIQIVFTICDNRSVYARNLELAIIGRGCVYVPWQQAISIEFDLAISASLNGPLAAIKAPLLLLSHGPGHTKSISIPDEANDEWRSLTSPSRFRRIIAATNEDDALLFPDVFEKTVIGDPMFDAILAAKKQRSFFRNQLGIRDRKLVVLSSTWGESATLATFPEIAEELIRRLPANEYAIASILHPNIWIGHGDWQVRVWCRDAIEAGMALVPFDDAWQAVVASADCLIGDHGSVTLYACMAGIPVARLSYDTNGMRPELDIVKCIEQTPEVTSADAAAAFAAGKYLEAQGPTAEQRAESFSHLGSATYALSSLIYDILEIAPLKEPRAPYDLVLSVRPSAPRAYYATIDGAHFPASRIKLFAAQVGRGKDTANAPLITRIDERNYRILQSCRAVICSTREHDHWRNACPNASHALIIERDKATLITRDGKAYAVRSDLTNPFASCAATISLFDRKTSCGDFSCGCDSGCVSIGWQDPTSQSC